MRGDIVVAAIAAGPPTFAALLVYLANSRSLRRSIGVPSGVPLVRVVQRLEDKLDRLAEGQATTRERIARLEGAQAPRTVPRQPKRARRVRG